LRLYEKEREEADSTAQAVCCHGLKLEKTGGMFLRFVEGQAKSATTIGYLEWVSEKLAGSGEKVLVMVWDNASWHRSKMVREWLKSHNQKARAAQKEGKGAVRIIPCYLPVKSPWLNSIEPCWMHGKRAVVEPQRKLSGEELVERVCNYFGCDKLPFIPK
jgi:transposase